MAELNKNSDNEQTLYAADDDYSTAEQPRSDMNNHRPQNAYPAGNAGAQQMYGNMQANQQQRQSQPQQNVYANQQQRPPQPQPYTPQPPQSQPYTPQPPQNMYGAPAGYNNNPGMQRVPVGYGTKKKKSNTALIVLVVLIVLLVCAIAGITAAIFLYDNDDDDSGRSRSNDSTSESYADNDDDDDDDDDRKSDEEVRGDGSSAIDKPSSSVETSAAATEAETTTEKTELKRYSMPNVCGMNGDEAKKILEDAGFIVEIVKEYNSQTKDTVIHQSIPEETVVIEGTEILLNVSLGPEPSQESIVPNVCGLVLEDAKRELEKYELFVNTAYEESDTVASGKVIEQNIAPGTKVKKGTSVLLVVSTGSKTPQYQRGRVVTKETDLNVRKGPGKAYDVIGMVARGSTVEIAGMDGDWYKIVFKNGFGYVSKDYIELIN